MTFKDTSLSRRLLIAFLTSIVGTSALAQSSERASQPKLVVGIVVDNLQNEYLNLLREYFGTGGFNMLLNRGVYIPNIDYGTNLDPAAATALLYTGATPPVNGIPSETVFDLSTLHSVPVFTDASVLGNFTDQSLSPAALKASTISDEVRIYGDGVSVVYAIAPDPSQALTMAGHAGNCGMWINDANDMWATSTFYRDVPQLLSQVNRTAPLSQRLDTMVWTPLHSSSRYTLVPPHVARASFRNDFRKPGLGKIRAFKSSPMVNAEVTDMAIRHIDELDLGHHDTPDMLSLSYTASAYPFSRNADNRFETIDTYYRLDSDLQRLFSKIDEKVGLPNTLVFLASTPPPTRTRRDDERWNIPYGEFSTRRAISLLNLYFIALYGNGNWVSGYHNGEFFLNRELIKQSEKDIETMRQQAASLLAQMEGVATSFSLDDIINNRAGIHAQPMKQNTHVGYAGDVKISVLPGWEILDDFNEPTPITHLVNRVAPTTAPAFIFAPGVTQQKINQTIDARTIAPTVAGLLRIRSPNAAALPPLELEF